MAISFKVNGVSKTPEELGVAEAKITKRCGARDELKLRFASPEYAAQFSDGDTIEAFAGTLRKFKGRAAKIRVELLGGSQTASLTAHNAWGELERIAYQQAWTRSTPTGVRSVYRGKVVLGQNAAGAKIGVGDQIRDILSYAISCGANMQIGNIDIDSAMLLDEARDLSCAQALLRALKWSPNAAAFFDYSGSGEPTLHVLKKGSLLRESAAISESGALKISVSPRPDLSLAGVSVKYERENVANGVSSLEVEEDNYPANISSAAKNVLVMSVDLEGKRSSCDAFSIVCGTINLSSRQWWRKHIPSLSSADFAILESSLDDDTYQRELLEGSIVAGMNFGKIRTAARAKIRYSTPDGTYITKSVAANILSTNAFTGTYYIWRVSQYAEQMPQGLARAIYEAASDLQYEGSAELSDSLGSEYIGRLVSISSASRPEWAAVKSNAVCVEENLSTGSTLVKFGPPKHLYPDEISELFRINRNRKSSDSAFTRSNATLAIQGGDFSADAAADNGAEGDCAYERLMVSSTSQNAETRNIDINSADLAANETASMRTIFVCQNGHLATAKVLMTSPVNYYSNQ